MSGGLPTELGATREERAQDNWLVDAAAARDALLAAALAAPGLAPPRGDALEAPAAATWNFADADDDADADADANDAAEHGAASAVEPGQPPRLEYNTRDRIAAHQVALEMQHARSVLGLDPVAPLSHEQALVACLPAQLVEELVRWISEGETHRITVASFVNYLKVECVLRYTGAPIEFVERAGFAKATQITAYKDLHLRMRAIKCPIGVTEAMQEAARSLWRSSFVHEDGLDVDHDASDAVHVFASAATGLVLDATLESTRVPPAEIVVDTAARLEAATSHLTVSVHRVGIEHLQRARLAHGFLIGPNSALDWVGAAAPSRRFPIHDVDVPPPHALQDGALCVSRRGRRTAVFARDVNVHTVACMVRHGPGDADPAVSRFETTSPLCGRQNWVMETNVGDFDVASAGGVKREKHTKEGFASADAVEASISEMEQRIYKLTQRALTQDWFLASLFRCTPIVSFALLKSAVKGAAFVDTEALKSLASGARKAILMESKDGADQGEENAVGEPVPAHKKRRREALDEAQRQTAFLQSVMPLWFSESIAGSSVVGDLLPSVLDLGTSTAWGLVFVKRYGLVTRRDKPFLATTPDGVVALRNGETSLLAALVIDPSALHLHDVDADATVLTECESGKPAFRDLVPDASTRARLVHDAAVLGVEGALLAKHVHVSEGGAGAAAGEDRLEWVLVRISEDHRAAWLAYQEALDERYMQFSSSADPRLPRVGENGCAAYGDAVEHSTAQLWLRLWKLYESDVVEHGTPPACRRMLPLVTSVWNKSRANMDAMLQCTRQHEAADATVWERLLSLTMYNAFRLHELAARLGGSGAHALENGGPELALRFRNFMLTLKNELHTEPFKRFFHHDQAQNAKAKVSRRKTGKYNALRLANTSEDVLSLRLNGDRSHVQTIVDSRNKDDERCPRLTCVVCCSSCSKGVAHRSRRGRKTRFQCFACNVALCGSDCWELWHNEKEIPLPKCLAE